MATVYLAQDLKHDRKVAIKVLKPELAAVLGAERFVVEIKTTAALQHPHILPLFDSGESDGFLWYAMPFIDGETLRAKLDRETQLGIDEAVKITTDVADALHYAHSKGVIHRDIKPENILLANGRADGDRLRDRAGGERRGGRPGAPQRCTRVVHGAHRVGIQKKTMSYYGAHAIIDIGHAEGWLEHVVRAQVADIPDSRIGIAEGLVSRANASLDYFDYCLAKLRAQ